jgi:hypothetical protein
MYDLSIIVVSWNTIGVTKSCLESIVANCCDLATETLVVDNASSDGSPEMIRDEFRTVTLIQSDTNVGFAKANNVALRKAHGKYVCLINSDVVVHPDCLQTLFEFMETNPGVGIIGPKMMTPRGTPGPSCMRRPSLGLCASQAFGLHRISNRFELHMDNYDAEVAQDVPVLNGWFWMVRASALEEVGLLDERFFMYGEDIDWCTRFWKYGWRVVYLPTASSTHLAGASSARDPVRFYIQLQQARLQYWRYHYSKMSQVACWLIMTTHQLLRLIGHGAAYIVIPSRRVKVAERLKANGACLSALLRTRPGRSSPQVREAL